MRTQIHTLKWGDFNLIEGDFISAYARTYGEWSEVEVQFFRQILSPNSNVIEVGANIGMHAVPIAKTVHQGKLFCFEPQRIIFQLLCSNLALNQLTNVYAYQQGVSDEASRIEIASSDYETAWNYGSFSLDKGFNTEGYFQGEIQQESVQVIRLDEHPEVHKLTELRLLKIDAEGFDLNVLKGASQTIEAHKPVIFIEAHRHQSQMLIRYLNGIGYQCFWFVSDRYQPNNHFGQPKTLSGLDYNLACFHQSQTPTLPASLLASPDCLLETFPLLSYN